jgi:hypothetical protein
MDLVELIRGLLLAVDKTASALSSFNWMLAFGIAFCSGVSILFIAALLRRRTG